MAKLCLGGTFNPIHHGHLICARAAAEAIGAAGILLIPSRLPPHKPSLAGIAAPAHRLEMCRLAISGSTGFEVDDRELGRSGPSYTIETVRQLKKEGWDSVAWLIGADMLLDLPHWHQAEALLQEVHFVVVARPGWKIDWSALPSMLLPLQSRVVQAPNIDISASEIRRRIAAGLPIDFLTPRPVCDYIRDHRLYTA